MKRNSLWMVLLFFGAASLQHCADESENARPEKIQFTFSFSETGLAGGRSQITAIPDALLLSMTNASGQSVFLNKKVNLIRMGGGFITEPLEITPGSYLVTDFMLVNDDAGVIYATPRQGSPLAGAVKHPLPYPVTVLKNKVSNITMEVIDVALRQPEDFGYVSFPINVVNPLEVAVFIPNGSDSTMTSARAYIVEGDDTVKQYNLSANINLISFPGDPQVARKLIITETGYNAEVKEFVYADLIADLNGQPWNIMLTPAVFTIIPRYNHFQMLLLGQPGVLMVNWGDGDISAYIMDPAGIQLEHNYGSVGTYQVTITQDIHKIERIYIGFNGIGAMKAINPQGLTALKEVRMGFMESPVVMDFSHSHQLAEVYMPVMIQLKTLILPQNTVIRSLDISGSNQMTTADIDALIDQVYAGALANHTQNGIFFLYHILNGERDGLLGPPSPDRVDKLRDLRDTFGWNTSDL